MKAANLRGILVGGFVVIPVCFALAATDALQSPDVGQVRLGDRPGELMAKSIASRCFSRHARTTVYDEAENAFATHWDDGAPDRAGWQNEYWGKMMLCYAGAIEVTRDPELKDWALGKMRSFVRRHMKPNGYLSTYAQEDFLRWHPDNPDYETHWCYNIWGRKYTLWALVELYRVTGDPFALEAAEKMADHLVAQLKRLNLTLDRTGSWAGISSMSILKPLLELYRYRPKPAYFEMARSCRVATDVADGPKPPQNVIYDALTDRPIESWYDKPMFMAKAYETMSYFEGLVEYYRVTDDARVLAAVRAFHRHLIGEELNAMRSAGYFDHFLHARRHVNAMTELCDVIHWMRLNRELFLLTGETFYADCFEEAFYNAFLPGVSPDGSWGAHIVRGHGTRHLAAPPQTGMTYHQCCPDNLLRGFYDVAGSSVLTDRQTGAIVVGLYADAVVDWPDARLEIAGGYPVGDTVRVVLDSRKPTPIRFRVPGWSRARFAVNGERKTSADGWVEVSAPSGRSSWHLTFDMRPRILDSSAPDREDIHRVTEKDTKKKEGGYTVFSMEMLTPEMKGLERETAAATVMRGPLVLAKGRLAGTSREETLGFQSVNKAGWRAEVLPRSQTAANASVWGSWTLRLTRGSETREIPVADFWSVSNIDDSTNWFSLWF